MSEKLSGNTNALNWFEIPAIDIERGKKFYENIFDVQMMSMDMMGMQMAMFPSMPPHVGGALVKSDQHKPSMDGAVVYVNGNPDLQKVLDKVVQAGGQILMPKTLIDEETGYMAFILDTEGNKLGIHSGQ
jgi:predicted enzyme related to lactoylglutathione lyase